jgi:hypothetical protein
MQIVTTGTQSTAGQMISAIRSGLTIALHFEDLDKPCGIAVFCTSIEEARKAYSKHKAGWQQWMLASYPSEELNDYKQVAIGWV